MKERPADIVRSIKNGNVEHVRNAGKKGGEATALRKDIEATNNDLAREVAELEEWQRKVDANEHIIDPDGIDQNFDNVKNED